MGEYAVDGGLGSLDDVEDSGGEAEVVEVFCEEEGGGGCFFGGFEDVGVAGGYGQREHPEGDHGGEVEWGCLHDMICVYDCLNGYLIEFFGVSLMLC
ncbi:hypothetical protein ACHAXS_006250 [Conticribra weissflogii]